MITLQDQKGQKCLKIPALFLLHHFRLPHQLTDKQMHRCILTPTHVHTHTDTHASPRTATNRCLVSGVLCLWDNGPVWASAEQLNLHLSQNLSPKAQRKTRYFESTFSVELSLFVCLTWHVVIYSFYKVRGLKRPVHSFKGCEKMCIYIFLLAEGGTACHPVWRLHGTVWKSLE